MAACHGQRQSTKPTDRSNQSKLFYERNSSTFLHVSRSTREPMRLWPFTPNKTHQKRSKLNQMMNAYCEGLVDAAHSAYCVVNAGKKLRISPPKIEEEGKSTRKAKKTSRAPPKYTRTHTHADIQLTTGRCRHSAFRPLINQQYVQQPHEFFITHSSGSRR